MTVNSTDSEVPNTGDNGSEQVMDAAAPDSPLAEKISLVVGDITKLEIDAIVNAANERMLGGGGGTLPINL